MEQEEQSSETLGPIVSSREEDPWRPGEVAQQVLIDAFELFRDKRKLGRMPTVTLLGKSSILVSWEDMESERRKTKEKDGVKKKRMSRKIRILGLEIRDFNGRTKAEMYTRNFFLGCLRHLVEGTPIPAQILKPRKAKKEVVEEPPAQSEEAVQESLPMVTEPPAPEPPSMSDEEMRREEHEWLRAAVDLLPDEIEGRIGAMTKDVLKRLDEQDELIKELKGQSARLSEGVWRMAGMLVELLKSTRVDDEEALKDVIERADQVLKKYGVE